MPIVANPSRRTVRGHMLADGACSPQPTYVSVPTWEGLEYSIIGMTMALRVFVSYSHREDQVLALRLQTLASTRSGLQVYVPPASTRGRVPSQSGSDLQELHQANLVLAIMSRAVPPTIVVRFHPLCGRSLTSRTSSEHRLYRLF